MKVLLYISSHLLYVISVVALSAFSHAAKGPSVKPCHASISAPEGFKAALLQHDAALQGFRRKFKTGRYAEPGVLNKELARKTSDELLKITAEAIANIADDRTGLLVYSITRKVGAQPKLCIWLLNSAGLIAAEDVEQMPEESLALGARAFLNVSARAGARLPVQLDGSKRAIWSDPPRPGAADASSMARIANLLLPDTIRAKLIAKQFSRLLVLPAFDLGTLPWPALQVDKDRQLVDITAVVILPDIDWILQGHGRIQRKHATAVVVGDPDLSKDSQYRFLPLPGAREEAEAVARWWIPRAELLTGDQAEHERVEREIMLRNPGVLYFATHGISDATNPMDGSFLALKGSHLYAREIKEFVIFGGPLVVMSACQTGLGKTFDGGTFGLARAWWQAGASQVVMSLWNIDDTATRNLMMRFMEPISFGDILGGFPSREETLRKAMLATRAETPDPALWASFLFFGMPTKQE
jgi:hypothetical protein